MAAEKGEAMIVACHEGDMDTVQDLLDLDESLVNTTEAWGDQSTPLIKAATAGHMAVVDLLLSRGARVNTANCRRGTALYYAARWGHENIVSLLLSKGADASLANLLSWNALMVSSQNGHGGTVTTLLRHAKQDVDRVDGQGRSALHYACIGRHAEVVRTLLTEGDANPAILDMDANTPRMLAEDEGVTAVLEWYEKECKRAYVLATVREMVDETESIIKAPEKVHASTAVDAQQARIAAAPAYLKGRVERGEALPRVDVPMMIEKSKRAERQEEQEEEVMVMEGCRAAVEYTVKWMKRDVYDELVEMMGPRIMQKQH